MVASITARALYDAHRERLALLWPAGQSGGQRAVPAQDAAEGVVSGGRLIVGHLNLIRPHPIQVLGRTELQYLGTLGKNSRQDAVDRLFAGSTVVVIITGGQPAPDDLVQAAQNSATPLFTSRLPGYQVINHLQYFLDAALAAHVTVHGVFLEVIGIGVLVTGDSGIGKSELALELISRGHRLVADDAPEFHRVAPDTLRGTCPPALRDFLEVRGLGILNIRAMFGDSAIKHDKNLRLIVHLEAMDERQMRQLDRLHGERRGRTIQGVEVPQVTLPVIPGLNLAVLVECAVRNHILRLRGYNADLEFAEQQQRYIVQTQP
jgi:HPr kinase/phosphorylase